MLIYWYGFRNRQSSPWLAELLLAFQEYCTPSGYILSSSFLHHARNVELTTRYEVRTSHRNVHYLPLRCIWSGKVRVLCPRLREKIGKNLFMPFEDCWVLRLCIKNAVYSNPQILFLLVWSKCFISQKKSTSIWDLQPRRQRETNGLFWYC